MIFVDALISYLCCVVLYFAASALCRLFLTRVNRGEVNGFKRTDKH